MATLGASGFPKQMFHVKNNCYLINTRNFSSMTNNHFLIKVQVFHLIVFCFWFLFLILTRGYVYWFRERGREREKNIWWLPPIHIPTRDWTCNLRVQRTTLQPPEPPSPGLDRFWLFIVCKLKCVRIFNLVIFLVYWNQEHEKILFHFLV